MSNYSYAASVAAQKITDDKIIINHSATVFNAGDDAEAQQYADTIALDVYPLEDGWTAHNSVVLKVTGNHTGVVKQVAFGDETFNVVTPPEDDRP